jgi:uncharacterized protein (UPF0332 family)
VKAEAAAFIEKAEASLRAARLSVGLAVQEPSLAGEAARQAYYAAFHAAQALIYERTGKVSKTHKGTHHQFHLHTQSDGFDPACTVFLKEGFGLKSTSDYESDPGMTVSAGAANEAIAAAEWFVSVVRKQLL